MVRAGAFALLLLLRRRRRLRQWPARFPPRAPQPRAPLQGL